VEVPSGLSFPSLLPFCEIRYPSDQEIQRQYARRTTSISDKATLMYRALPFFSAIIPSLMASVFLMCSGCASHTHPVRQRLTVQIVSQPAGAQIEMNGQYVGDAPLNIQIEASNDGHFWRDTVIKAYPKETGYIQIKAFNGQSNWAISDMVPSRLFFDTRNDPGAEFEKPLPQRSRKLKPAPLPNP